jgi:hypothetical protein
MVANLPVGLHNMMTTIRRIINKIIERKEVPPGGEDL